MLTNILVVVYLYLIVQMCLVWLIYRYLGNPSIVDVAWPVGLVVSGLIYMWTQPITTRITVMSVLLILWGLRLAGYLLIARIRKGQLDKRYTNLSSDWKVSKSVGFFFNFQLQAVFIFIVSSVFFCVSRSPLVTLSLLDVFASIVIIIGIIGESLADYQLQSFKEHSNGVCNVGLWRYSRHPNYFFDWLTWCGFALVGFQYAGGWAAVLSPLFLYIIFTRITGPITEHGSIESRGQAFMRYQAETSMFFPWFVNNK